MNNQSSKRFANLYPNAGITVRHNAVKLSRRNVSGER